MFPQTEKQNKKKHQQKTSKPTRKSKCSFMLFVVEIYFNVFTLQSSKKSISTQILTVIDCVGRYRWVFFLHCNNITAGAETYYVVSTWNKLGFKNLITLGLLSGAVCWQNVTVHEWHVLRVESLWQLKYPCFPIKPECQQLPHWGLQCNVIHSSQIFCGTEWSESCMAKQLNWRKWRKIPGNLSET